MVSIPERIIEVLETESKLTIKEIFERLNESIDKLEYVRICIYRLLKSKSPKIVKDGKKGKEYLYSLKENAETSDILLDGLYEIMDGKMEFKKDLNKSEENLIDIIEKRRQNNAIIR